MACGGGGGRGAPAPPPPRGAGAPRAAGGAGGGGGGGGGGWGGGGARGSRVWRVAGGVLAGLVLIHLGGLAQLAILAGDLRVAAQLGTWPFLLGDFLKLVIAVPVLLTLTPKIRARPSRGARWFVSPPPPPPPPP